MLPLTAGSKDKTWQDAVSSQASSRASTEDNARKLGDVANLAETRGRCQFRQLKTTYQLHHRSMSSDLITLSCSTQLDAVYTDCLTHTKYPSPTHVRFDQDISPRHMPALYVLLELKKKGSKP